MKKLIICLIFLSVFYCTIKAREDKKLIKKKIRRIRRKRFTRQKCRFRRSLKERIEKGIVKGNDKFMTKEYKAKIKAKAASKGWIPNFEKSIFKDMTNDQVAEFFRDPKTNNKREKEIKAKTLKSRMPNPKNEKARRNAVPETYVFYYPNKVGKYQSCYQPTKNPVRDQHWCENCFLSSSTHVFDDRYCMINKNKGFEAFHPISMQYLMSCDTRFKCKYGVVADVNKFYEDKGVVQEKCLSYKTYSCDVSGKQRTCVNTNHKCPTATGYESLKEKCEDNPYMKNSDRLYAKKESSLSTYDYQHSANKMEIFKNGPITISFDVYSCFAAYSGGVYDRTSDEFLGSHTCECLGYGYEDNIPVWFMKNSWGSEWGEEGFFKIRRYDGRDGVDESRMKFGEYAYWTTPVTSQYSCNGIASDMSYVCGSHGKCVGIDKCECNSGWQGPTCEESSDGSTPKPEPNPEPKPEPKPEPNPNEEYTCFGINEYELNVCSGKGVCMGKDKCECDPGYKGTKCETKDPNYNEDDHWDNNYDDWA